jgi:hypothetical protein
MLLFTIRSSAEFSMNSANGFFPFSVAPSVNVLLTNEKADHSGRAV